MKPVIKEQPLQAVIMEVRTWNSRMCGNSLDREEQRQVFLSDMLASGELSMAVEAAKQSQQHNQLQEGMTDVNASLVHPQSPQRQDSKFYELIVPAIQQYSQYRRDRRAKYDPDVPVRERSQEELDSMPVPVVLPFGDELKCVLKDGSRISLEDGFAGMAIGLMMFGSLYEAVSPLQQLCVWQLAAVENKKRESMLQGSLAAVMCFVVGAT